MATTKAEVEKKLLKAQKELDDLKPLKKYTKTMERELKDVRAAFKELKESVKDYDEIRADNQALKEALDKIDNNVDSLKREPVEVPALINKARVILSLRNNSEKYPEFKEYFEGLISFVNARLV